MHREPLIGQACGPRTRQPAELSVYERVSAGCPLIPRARLVVGECDLPACGKDLGGRLGRWCSRTCADLFFFSVLKNHDWKYARAAAIERDKRCVSCGWDGGRLDMEAEIAALGAAPAWPRERDAFARIREQRRATGAVGPRGGAGWIESAMEDPQYVTEIAQSMAFADARAAIINRFAKHPRRLEVNHIEPRRGQGYGPGCHHHLTGLESLCRPCHIIATTRQRATAPASPAPLSAAG